jgi:hypothetical protein
MHARDYTDIIAGLLLIGGGLWAALHAMANYSLGSVTHMGPGMFPAALGFLLAGLGVLVLLPALFRAGTLPQPDYRQFFLVVVGVALFALVVDRLGMIPAIFILTIAAVLADNKVGVIGTAILAAVLSFISVAVFRWGLGIPIQPYNWPF